jgi:hypothetical protein
LEDRLDQFGGATRDTALHQGWYPDPDTGQRVTDDSRRYVVALPEDQVDELREACTVFQQKCIYLSVAGYVEFAYGPGHEAE